MRFFDDKEEILDIQLTQYGKHLLSLGKFDPTYYAFFDDDVLYDSEYIDTSDEAQNDVQARIEEDTPQLHTQHVFSGRETAVKENNRMIRSDITKGVESLIQQTPDRHYALSAPLGNSSLQESSLPAISIKLLSGLIAEPVSYINSQFQTMKIPQLEMDAVTYETYPSLERVDMDKLAERADELDGGINPVPIETLESSALLNDGTLLKTKEDSILIEINEDNVEFLNENFDIEVFLIEEVITEVTYETEGEGEGIEVETGYNEIVEKLIPLSFVKPFQNVVNGILLDDDEVIRNDNPEVDPSYVEHFMEIRVDGEIPVETLCAAKPEALKRGVFTNEEQLDCPTPRAKDVAVTNLYDPITDHPDETTGEEC